MNDLFHKPLQPAARANLQPELVDMIQSARRELGMRVRCYPVWVRKGTMKQAQADWEIACMAGILKMLEDLARAGIVS